MKLLFSIPASALLVLLAAPGAPPKPDPSAEKIWEYRNLGKAFYENPDTHQQAVDILRRALDLAPDSVRERLNYGLALLRAGQTEAGVAELRKVQSQDPSLPHTWFNLGIAYKHSGDYDKAIEQFQGMIRLTPNEPRAHYNLAAVLRSKGDNAAALSEFQIAEKLNSDLAGPHFQLFTLYQRAHDTEKAAAERRLFEEVKKRNEGAAVPEDMEWCFYAELYDPPEPRPSTLPVFRYKEATVSNGWDAASTRTAILDASGTGEADLLIWSPQRISLLKHGQIALSDTGLESLTDIRDIAPADFDNDGKTDLCVLTNNHVVLLRNMGGRFEKAFEAPANAARAVWLDFDHDNDIDLLVFGEDPLLLRNDANGKFEPRTEAFPFVKGKVLDAVVTAVRGDTAGRDLVVSYSDRPGTLYTDKLNGVFAASDIPLKSGTQRLFVQDIDHDGLLDIASYAPSTSVLHNTERGFVEARDLHPEPDPIRADFNGDGREDYARLLPSGELHLFLNDSPVSHWLAARIEGVKNPKMALNATVEVKAGAVYDKRLYSGVPLSFSLADRATADTVRITWPNGLMQNETNQKEVAHANPKLLVIQEAQRLSGSCPMIFTWNGRNFEFVTDVLGVAPLGASSGDGRYFPVDHDEYIQIPGRALHPENGEYRVHITEELHEVSYLDEVQLIALDHPTNIPVYTNDKFKSPPYPEFRLYGAENFRHPLRALEDSKIDVTQKLRKIDGIYPDSFPRNQAGVAGMHTLELDFGHAAPNNRAVLVLNGWVDWADGSTFLGASQGGEGLRFPYLQVKDNAGKWQTVVEDMGIPSGKPKTIAVDLTGKFLSSDRSVRIITSLCVYWDEIRLLEDSAPPPVRLTPLTASKADLHFRGFSRVVVDPRRQQPERFVYDEVRPISNWNPTPGRYTHYGDVRPLVAAVDDKLLIMGSGDEVQLSYPADRLPALPAGWTRDFLLLVDGWAKDADANTAFSQSVEPLPFHGMSAYPYRADEHFPRDAEHTAYVREYLTRPGLQLIRPLVSVTRPQ